MTDAVAAKATALAHLDALAANMSLELAALRAEIEAVVVGPPTRVVDKALATSTDATAAIQTEIDALPVSGPGTVVIPAGYSFWVSGDPAKCLKLRSGKTLQIDGTLKVKPNALERTYAVLVEGVQGASVVMGDTGEIVGDRTGHTYTNYGSSTDPSTHEWGMGIAVYGSQNITIMGGVISNCTGDGIVIGRESADVTVDGTICTQNRRQGVTVGRCSRVTLRNGASIGTGALNGQAGAKPMAGIDVEPDTTGSMLCEDVLVENWDCLNNDGCGIETNAITKNGVTPTLRRITVKNSKLAGNGYGAHIQRVTGLTFDGNHSHDNRWHGCRLLSGTTTAKAIEGNTFGNNYTESLGPLTRSPAITDDGFVQNRDLKREDSAGVCVAGMNTYR